MHTIFNAIFPDEIKISTQNVQSLLDAYRERQKTGVVRLGYEFEKRLYFLYKRGEALNVYLVTPEKCEAVSFEHGVEWLLSAGESYAKSIPLSSQGVLTAKLALQSSGGPVEVIDSQRQLSEWLLSFEGGDDAVLANLSWKNASGCVFFPPHNTPHYVLVSQDVILNETGSYKALCEWSESRCTASVFWPDLAVDAWQEYYLRSAFAYVCEGSISRFEVLTGRALVDSLVRLVNVFASRHSMDISVVAHNLVDNEIFPSPQKALYAYRLLLAELFNHFSAVIGPRLYASTLREILKSMPVREREIIRRHELLPKGYVYE